MTDAEYKAYRQYLASLTDSELENERYTVEREWKLIGMPEDVAVDKASANCDEAADRAQKRLSS